MPHTVPVSRALRQVLIAASIGAIGISVIAARPSDNSRLNASSWSRQSDGLTFVYSITSANGVRDKKQKERLDRVATVRIQDGNARMDFTVGTPAEGQKGYMLVLGGAKQFAIVNDKDKKAIIMDAAMMGSGAGSMLNNPLFKMTYKDASFAYQDLGAGDKILGYSTRHVRITNGSTMEMRVLGMKRSSTNADTSEQWIATGVGIDEATLVAWAKAFGSGVKATNPELAAQMEKYHQEYGRTGIALRSVMYSNVTDEKGKLTRDTLTTEVTDLKKGRIDDAMFKIPAGYEVMNMSEMMNGGKK